MSKCHSLKVLSAPVIKPGRHEYFPRSFQEQENCWALETHDQNYGSVEFLNFAQQTYFTMYMENMGKKWENVQGVLMQKFLHEKL